MRARRKGTNEPFMEIELVTFAGSTYEDGLYNVSVKGLEFEQEPNTSDHWQDLRERAAIAAIQAFCAAPVTKDTESMTIDEAAKFAVEIADALVEKLKGE